MSHLKWLSFPSGQITAHAHYIKSSAAQFGLAQMAEAAKALELQGRRGVLEDARTGGKAIAAAFREAVPILESYLLATP